MRRQFQYFENITSSESRYRRFNFWFCWNYVIYEIPYYRILTAITEYNKVFEVLTYPNLITIGSKKYQFLGKFCVRNKWMIPCSVNRTSKLCSWSLQRCYMFAFTYLHLYLLVKINKTVTIALNFCNSLLCT